MSLYSKSYSINSPLMPEIALGSHVTNMVARDLLIDAVIFGAVSLTTGSGVGVGAAKKI